MERKRVLLYNKNASLETYKNIADCLLVEPLKGDGRKFPSTNHKEKQFLIKLKKRGKILTTETGVEG